MGLQEKYFNLDELLERVNVCHFFVFSFIFFAVVSIVRVPGYILIDDEIFYLAQAKAIASGQFIFFDRGNPYLFPILLSPFIRLELLPLLRMIPAFFMSLAVGIYFYVLEKHLNKTTAFFASLLFMSHVLTVEHAIRIYTEGLLFIFLFLSFDKTLDIAKGKSSWKNFLLLGCYAGLLLQVKALIPLVPFVFILFIFVKGNFTGLTKAFVSIIISFLIYFPYLFFNGINYFQEKFGPAVSLISVAHRAWLGVEAFGIVILFLACVAFARFLRNKINHHPDILLLSLFFLSGYIFCILFIIVVAESRYYLLALPFLIIFVSSFIFSQTFLDRSIRKEIIRFTFLFLLLSQFLSILKIPSYTRNYHFLPNKNWKHMELRCAQQEYLYRNVDSDHLWSPVAGSAHRVSDQQKREVCLPFFEQKNNSVAKYRFVFESKNEFSFLFIAHVCDKAHVVLDDRPITNGWSGNPYVPLQLQFKEPLSKGIHELEIYIFQENNIGGIGQVLLAEESLIPSDNPQYFWIF